MKNLPWDRETVRRVVKPCDTRWNRENWEVCWVSMEIASNTTFRLHFQKELCSQTFKASLEDIIVVYSEKMKAKCMKDDVWKSFFC